MNEVTLIGIDLGKHVFHLRAQDAKGHEVFRKKLSRASWQVSSGTSAEWGWHLLCLPTYRSHKGAHTDRAPLQTPSFLKAAQPGIRAIRDRVWQRQQSTCVVRKRQAHETDLCNAATNPRISA
ncbi:hypothetical protein BX592_1141 [Paraburkholderia rhizosphaerae]|uniref:Transposase n=1 Tax=Paraburkholderia rhizosphaerae TaxID=480658 RepID=A0A4R8LLC0_9BURK|nr:hypothetical protein BX592_1141 [Paraburkholderia rhizosphaerae]